jgi:hypothetical protein
MLNSSGAKTMKLSGNWAVVIFLLATGLMVGRFSHASGQSDPTQVSPKSVPDTFSSRSKLVRISNGVTRDGFAFTKNTYRGPDGQVVDFEIFHFHSKERVTREFDDAISHALKIIDRAKKTGEDGHTTSQMAVLTSRKEGGDEVVAMVVISAGEDFRTVRSSSLQDVLDAAAEIKRSAQTGRSQ